MKRHQFYCCIVLLFAVALPADQTQAGETVQLFAAPQDHASDVVAGVDGTADCFAINVTIDPVAAKGGDLQVVSGFAVGMSLENDDVMDRSQSILTVDFREGVDRSAHLLWHRGTNLTLNDPSPQPAGWVDTREYQHFHNYLIRDGLGHKVRLVVWPDGVGSRIRLFVDAMDRPREEHLLGERITAGTIRLFTSRGGLQTEPTRTSTFSDFEFKKVPIEEANRLPTDWETLLANLDPAYPAMQPVVRAAEEGRRDDAKSLFLEHMRTRTTPLGPTWEHVTDRVLHPAYRGVADAAVSGQYGGARGFFMDFSETWTDTNGDTHGWVREANPLQINWSRDNGSLNRHFHWVSLAKSYDETGDARYAKQFSAEVFDWVTREPFFWEATPIIGGLNIMDGTRFRRGYMNTSNIGRRLELTWWPTYEVFRKSPEFTDEAHIAMLVGMIRQADLITNPTSFAVHDDGAAHTTMGLLQTALLLPELHASKEWKELALSRWDEMLGKQFHPDGSHVSLSTGYNWATILTLENFIRLYEQLGKEPPAKYLSLLEKALEHPIAISTPNQLQVPQNDGGWSMVDDHYRRSLHWFPHREDFQWMATKGTGGTPPEKRSQYLPNAGHYMMRTGWGGGEKYLFFGAGPWGASHGKQDALNIFTQLGSSPLIRDAGRRSYSGVGNTVHAGRSLAYNTLSPDWAQENSIPHWRHEMHVGFNPPNRRWVSNESFEYGEGAFTYGWHNSEEHIRGKWLRQVIFVKGQNPKADGYYVVIDTVEPADNAERVWRHPWQLNPDAIEVREADKSIVATNAEAAIQILPIDLMGDIAVTVIQGQVTPELLGWRIYGEAAKPWPVPTYSWTANETFCRAWIIQMQATEGDWPVESVEPLGSEFAGELRFRVYRRDGGTDDVLRRFPSSGPATVKEESERADVTVESRNRSGDVIADLKISGGRESVAAPMSFSR